MEFGTGGVSFLPVLFRRASTYRDEGEVVVLVVRPSVRPFVECGEWRVAGGVKKWIVMVNSGWITPVLQRRS